jgi:hypothetical protein
MDKSCDLNLKYVHNKGVFLKKNQTTIAPRDMIFIFLSDKGWPYWPGIMIAACGARKLHKCESLYDHYIR